MLVEPGIAKIYAVGQDKGYNFLVIDHLGAFFKKIEAWKPIFKCRKNVSA